MKRHIRLLDLSTQISEVALKCKRPKEGERRSNIAQRCYIHIQLITQLIIVILNGTAIEYADSGLNPCVIHERSTNEVSPL